MLNAIKDVRIGIPILIGNVIMLILMGIISFSGITGMERVAQSNASALKRRTEMADLRMLQLYLKTMYNDQIIYINDGDPVDAQAFHNSIVPLRDIRKKIRTTIETEEERLNLNIIDRQTDEYINLFMEKSIPAREINDIETLIALKEQSGELISQMDPVIQNMIADYEMKSEKADQNARDTKSQTFLIVIILSTLTIIIGLASGIFLAKTTSDSARKIIMASEQLRKSETALKDSERMLSNIFDHIPNTVFVKDAENLHFVRLNRAGENLLGISRENCIGKSDHDFFSKEIADLSREKDLETLRSRLPLDIPEETIITPSLGKRIIFSQKIPILDEEGNPKYLMGISEDITERKQIDDQIREMNAKLEQRVVQRTSELELSTRELESFAYSISHDLRAPLRAMEGFSHILMEEYGNMLGKEGIQYLRRIRVNAVRMAKLIDDLLDLSRITRRDLHRKQVDMAIIADTIMTELRAGQPDRQVEFIHPEHLITQADPRLMNIAINNILDNAWKYTQHKVKTVIEFGCQDDDGRQVYFIRDNGIGFDMAYVHKIFKAFQRLNPREDIIGTGVGLAMTQRIIQRHGGRIWAEGEVNRGAVFYFTLE